MAARNVVLVIQNVLSKRFIHFNSSSKEVELQPNEFSKGIIVIIKYA